MEMHTLGIDRAKNTYQLYGADPSGKVVTRKRLPRHKLAAFIANTPACNGVLRRGELLGVSLPKKWQHSEVD